MIKFAVPLITCLMLVGVAADQASREVVPVGVEEYHARIRHAEKLISYNIGDWLGNDTEIRQEALKILDANSTVSRKFVNLKTQRSATLLMVQCADARSLLGHYPPVCYPSTGWSQLSAESALVPPPNGPHAATQYAFGYDLMNQLTSLRVVHFTVLPEGRIAPDMSLLESAARDRRLTFLGGASVQFIVDSDMSESEQKEAFQTLFQAATPWIEAVRAGIAP